MSRRSRVRHGFLLFVLPWAASAGAAERPRAREAGIEIGILKPGPLNAITDVAGVRIGHVTLVEGTSTRTGVTAILPHGDNLYQDKVPAGFAVGNGYGKFMGSTQIRELGEIESPILLTNTLSVPEAAAAAIEWTLDRAGNEKVRSVNAVVGETNDGGLNDIRARRVTKAHGLAAIAAAREGEVAEGSVGAGTGTIAFGWKGGIGTSSRRLPANLGGFTTGVLVQTNYGGVLSVDGAPVGKALGRFFLKDALSSKSGDGSVIVVIATDAPVSDRNLERLARRAFLALGRTGSPMTNGSGDYAVAFSTAASVRRTPARRNAPSGVEDLPNELISPLFEAVVEATEEAVLNSMFAAATMEANGIRVEALPIDEVVRLHRQGRPR
ncbi:DmpA family aminopeptidase [Sphingosinicella rhizophila]|uniref:P1 family peptidase n=1 Tax=Sphingosinicella rhizophila TaxID=3050082 RepID=A0ABU3QBA7_9SPHN|nr:P1 family peptidase [Sphingosinicella sp. GR2756]MDT9600690.1 P1 family peptidase [Sphingosinicella sp. GR2756]